MDSLGGRPDLPDQSREREKLALLQQKLSRMQRGSKNHQEHLQKIRLLHEHMANQRRDFVHKESRRLADAWDAVRVTDAEAVSDGFGLFRACLRYKLERQGKTYLDDPAETPES